MRMYQDQENRAYVSILRTLFPEQTKTLPRILVWSVIFLIDLIAVVAGAYRLGLIPYEGSGKLVAFLILAAVFGIFWLQGYLWGVLQKLKE